LLFSNLVESMSKQNFIEIKSITNIFDISDVALIDGRQSEYTNTTLYFGYYEQLPGGRLPAQCVLAKTEASSALQNIGTDLALAGDTDLFFLVNMAKELVDVSRSKGLYAELIDCASQTQSIEPIINSAATKLGNSVILLDADFKVLAHSTIFPITDPLWEGNIRQGYCSYEFVSAVAELDSVKNAPPTSDPVLVTCRASPLRKLSSKVFSNGQKVGIFLMLEKETPISSAHMEMLPVISSAISVALMRYAPYLITGNGIYQKLLYDMLIGASPAEIVPKLSGLSFPPHLCAMCIRPTRNLGQRHLIEHVARQLTQILPDTRFTFHENGIAAVVALGDAWDLSEEQISRLETFAKNEFLRIGTSNAFSHIANFAKRYAQARRALSLLQRLRPEAIVCRYSDYSFYDLLDSVKEPDSLGSFCHPALALLRKYDRDNGMDLYHTLEAYLACGCNVKQTANSLRIHRNSLSYRLARIGELTQTDLEDSSIRFLLAMSYRVDHFSSG
jgi:hypothetical protein